MKALLNSSANMFFFKTASIIIFIMGITLTSCNRNLSSLSPLDNDWTLEAVPNVIDTIGTVFAIKGKQQRYITTINLNKAGGPGQLPTKTLTKSISAGAMASFLMLKKIDSASVSLSDTSKITSVFDVSNAYYGRQNGNLKEAFIKQKQLIIDNLEAYEMLDAKILLITEIIKSPSVNINLAKKNNANLTFKGEIAKLIAIKPSGLQFTNKDSTTLKYTLNEPLVIFYKLNPINVNIIGGREPGTKREVNLILDERPLKQSELYLQNP